MTGSCSVIQWLYLEVYLPQYSCAHTGLTSMKTSLIWEHRKRQLQLNRTASDEERGERVNGGRDKSCVEAGPHGASKRRVAATRAARDAARAERME